MEYVPQLTWNNVGNIESLFHSDFNFELESDSDQSQYSENNEDDSIKRTEGVHLYDVFILCSLE